jgi:hypothetical protein
MSDRPSKEEIERNKAEQRAIIESIGLVTRVWGTLEDSYSIFFPYSPACQAIKRRQINIAAISTGEPI